MKLYKCTNTALLDIDTWWTLEKTESYRNEELSDDYGFVGLEVEVFDITDEECEFLKRIGVL